MARKTIKIVHYPLSGEYQVAQVCNSIEYKPGQYLKESEVERLCNSAAWHITIAQPSNK